jgi:hypothetical protein
MPMQRRHFLALSSTLPLSTIPVIGLRVGGQSPTELLPELLTRLRGRRASLPALRVTSSVTSSGTGVREGDKAYLDGRDELIIDPEKLRYRLVYFRGGFTARETCSDGILLCETIKDSKVQRVSQGPVPANKSFASVLALYAPAPQEGLATDISVDGVTASLRQREYTYDVHIENAVVTSVKRQRVNGRLVFTRQYNDFVPLSTGELVPTLVRQTDARDCTLERRVTEIEVAPKPNDKLFSFR